jgi:hypothetical protein
VVLPQDGRFHWTLKPPRQCIRRAGERGIGLCRASSRCKPEAATCLPNGPAQRCFLCALPPGLPAWILMSVGKVCWRARMSCSMRCGVAALSSHGPLELPSRHLRVRIPSHCYAPLRLDLPIISVSSHARLVLQQRHVAGLSVTDVRCWCEIRLEARMKYHTRRRLGS